MSKELIERLRNTTYRSLDPYEAADRIEQLEAENARLKEVEKSLTPLQHATDLQLAASQAREQQLQAALSGAYKALEAICEEMTVGDRYTNAGQYLIDSLCPSREALAAPSDTTALEALIRKAGDVMRERCACIRHDEKLEKAIRALPGVTLEDLK